MKHDKISQIWLCIPDSGKTLTGNSGQLRNTNKLEIDGKILIFQTNNACSYEEDADLMNLRLSTFIQ